MSNFTFHKSSISGLIIVEPRLFGDHRGYFMETYHAREFELGGISSKFVQDNQSSSKHGVLRGLHFQKVHPQAKLVRIVKGEVFDVAVDLREDSDTYGRWFGIVLSEKNRKQLFIPEGFAHGFLVLSDYAEFSYKCSDYYHPEDEGGIRYDDPSIGIEWPLNEVKEVILSEKDKQWGMLSER